MHIAVDSEFSVDNLTEHMVIDKKAITYTDRVHLAMHLDGHGSPALKIKTYNGLYNRYSCRTCNGWI